MVSIIPEITHGFKNEGEKCLVRHIESLAKCFLMTGSETQRGKHPPVGQIQTATPSLVLSFLSLMRDDIYVAIRALIYLPAQEIYLASYVLVGRSRS